MGKRENLAATFRKGKQLEISGEASISINPSIDGELLVMSDFNSKLDKPWILDIACTLHMSPKWELFLAYKEVTKSVGDNR